jgi:hypothetical protein
VEGNVRVHLRLFRQAKHPLSQDVALIGATAAYVVGLEPADSMDLLVRLRDWSTQPQFVYHHDTLAGA